MFERDLERWKYTRSEYSGTECYISGSDRVAILSIPENNIWIWRVYDEGVPSYDPDELLEDQNFNHELGNFENQYDAYQDVIIQGMARH